MLCYGECFLCLVMYSTDYTYLCCIGYIIFIGANRFGPGQKNLGKGWILLTYLFIKGPSLIYIQHLIFNFNICTEKEPSIVLIAIYVSVSQIQSVLSSSFFSPSQNCHPIIFLLNWKHLSDYFELHSKIESASKHFIHMYSGLMITQSGMDHYMDHSDLV